MLLSEAVGGAFVAGGGRGQIAGHGVSLSPAVSSPQKAWWTLELFPSSLRLLCGGEFLKKWQLTRKRVRVWLKALYSRLAKTPEFSQISHKHEVEEEEDSCALTSNYEINISIMC